MLKVISWFIIGFVYNLFYCYAFAKLISMKFRFNKIMISLCTIFSLINCYSFYYIPHIRVAVINLCAIILLSIVYKKSILSCGLGQLCTAIINGLCEIIFIVVFCQIFNLNNSIFSENIQMIFLSNLAIIALSALFVDLLSKTKFKLFISNRKVDTEKNIIFLVLLSFCIISILLYPLSKEKLNPYTFSLYLVTFLSGLVFIMAFLLEKNKETKIINEYDSLFKYVKIYEKLIDEKSKQQHENRNQLIIIKSMLTSKNSKASKYIDQMLNIDDDTKNYNYLNKLKNIPEGIKGLIFYKIEEMKNEGIDVYLDIPDKFKKATVDLVESNLCDLSRILGVYLDNAKEAAMQAEKKYIIIELSDINNAELTISNTYRDHINLEKIDKTKYTSKGKGHGYGLALAKDIIENNNHIDQSRSIEGIYFVQKIILRK